MKKNKKEILVISSVSGGGKNTIITEIMRRFPLNFQLAITATTRKPRVNEVHGKDYYFISTEEFIKMIESNELIEHAKVHENYYGIPLSELQKAQKEHKTLILNIDYQGLRTIRSKFPDSIISIFLMPPSEEVWLKRLNARNTESREQLEIRIQQGKIEIEASKEYDYIVINDDLQRCVDEIITILKKEGILLNSK